MKRKVHYRGREMTLNTEGFDNRKPSVVIQSYQGQCLMMNVDGMELDWVMKESMQAKMRSLSIELGNVLFLIPAIENTHQPQEREIVRCGVTFVETAFRTKDELMVVWVPKDLKKAERTTPTHAPVATEKPSWDWDDSHPYLVGKLLGRQFTYAKTTDGHRLVLGPLLERRTAA